MMACLELVKWVCCSLPAEMKGNRSLENLGEQTSMAGVMRAGVWEAGTPSSLWRAGSEDLYHTWVSGVAGGLSR